MLVFRAVPFGHFILFLSSRVIFVGAFNHQARAGNGKGLFWAERAGGGGWNVGWIKKHCGWKHLLNNNNNNNNNSNSNSNSNNNNNNKLLQRLATEVDGPFIWRCIFVRFIGHGDFPYHVNLPEGWMALGVSSWWKEIPDFVFQAGVFLTAKNRFRWWSIPERYPAILFQITESEKILFGSPKQEAFGYCMDTLIWDWS